MAKRHHKHHMNDLGSEFYAGMDGRRRLEGHDYGMIDEDHSAQANLPQNVIMSKYEEGYSYMPEGLDDTIRGVDRQIGMDDGKRRSGMRPRKV